MSLTLDLFDLFGTGAATAARARHNFRDRSDFPVSGTYMVTVSVQSYISVVGMMFPTTYAAVPKRLD